MNRPGQPEQAETFGLPDCDQHLIAKLRTLQATDPSTYAAIRNTKVECI